MSNSIEINNIELIKLVEWVMNEVHFKRVKDARNYAEFKEKMKQNYHTCYFGVGCLNYSVMFNSAGHGGKVAYRFGADEDYRTCRFDRLVKAIWDTLQEQDKPVQLSLFGVPS